ncbi:MAG: twin-arginine translocase TatA/TatE family subunit [Candidatus Firestonebacteria bacterium]|nr:twin-arginine translocase TatA/TatE family subunit [Candidatus Firestonebacteria bacterium]
MFGLGFQEILLLGLVALILFGAKKLPDVGKALGESIREFKKAMQGDSAPAKKEAAGHDDAKT